MSQFEIGDRLRHYFGTWTGRPPCPNYVPLSSSRASDVRLKIPSHNSEVGKA